MRQPISERKSIPWFPAGRPLATIERVLDMAFEATMMMAFGGMVGMAIASLTRGSLIWMALGGMIGAVIWLVDTVKNGPSGRYTDFPRRD